MPKTQIVNLTLCEFADYSAVGTVTDGSTGAIIDISGWVLKADIKASLAAAAEVLGSFSFAFVTDGTDGQYERTISRAVITALGITDGYWDQMYSESGLTTKMMGGRITVEQSITDVDA